MVRRFSTVSHKIIFFIFILFFVFSMLVNGLNILANQLGGSESLNEPLLSKDSPSENLKKCLEWYDADHPTPINVYHKGECKEIVGYKGIFSWMALDFMHHGTGRFLDGFCVADNDYGGQSCVLSGTIGETTDELIDLEGFEFSPTEALNELDSYNFTVLGFVRCSEPVLEIKPEKKGMLVGEYIEVEVHLDCGYEMCLGEPVILEVVSGPGELNLPELTAEDLKKIYDSDYFINQDDIMITHAMIAKAMLHATDKGTIEIKATYDSCRGKSNQSTISKTVQVNVGKCVEIDCTYQTDPNRFGDGGLQWGSKIHCEACLEVFEEEQFGMKVRSLKGNAKGTQDCWVKTNDEYSWIENKKCPAFTGVVEGSIWGNNIYTFKVTIDESAALTFDLCSGEKERPQRLTRHEWDPVNFMGVPIHLDASDPNAEYVYEEPSDIIGTQYKVVARWQ